MQPLSGSAALWNLITSTLRHHGEFVPSTLHHRRLLPARNHPPANMKHQNLSFVHADGLWAARHGKVCVLDVRVAAGYDADLSGSATRPASGGAAAAVN